MTGSFVRWPLRYQGLATPCVQNIHLKSLV